MLSLFFSLKVLNVYIKHECLADSTRTSYQKEEIEKENGQMEKTLCPKQGDFNLKPLRKQHFL